MAAFDDLRELTASLHQEKDVETDIAHSIFILCSYDKHSSYNIQNEAHHEYRESHGLSQSHFVNQHIVNIESTIFECPHPMLKIFLLMYGFTDTFKLLSLWTIYRIFIFLCLCFGYYALIEIDSNTHNNTNHFADYIIIAVETGVYPTLYIVMQIYFTQKKHFWILCSDNSTAFTSKLSNYLTRALIICLLICIAAATTQKWQWAIAHNVILKETDPFRLILYIWFYLTFILRLFELFLLSIIFTIIAKFHHQQIISLINKFKLTNIIINKANASIRDISVNEDDIEYDSNLSSYNDMILQKRKKKKTMQSINDNKRNICYDMEGLFIMHASIRVDILHTNSNITWFLIVFYVAIIVDMIVVFIMSLFGFIDFQIFIDNASDLFIMTVLALYILYWASKVTEEFNGISNKVLRLHHYENAFIGWDIEKLMKLLQYFDQNKSGFKLSGILLNYSMCIAYLVLLLIVVLTTIGTKKSSL